MNQVTQDIRSGALKVENVPIPTLQPGGLLVGNHVSLISPGTEKATVAVGRKSLLGKAMARTDMSKKLFVHMKKNGIAETAKLVFDRLGVPTALGYSCAGTVLAVGSRVTQFSVGDRVACAGQNYASHAEIVYVPKNLCVKVPDRIDTEDAAFVTLGAIALQGVRQADLRIGECVSVIGLGLLGQLTVQILKASGCCVLASDFDPTKNELATALGADMVVSPNDLPEAAAAFSKGHGVDAVIITASTKDNAPINQAGMIAKKKGRVVVVGAVGMTISREQFYAKELELRLSMSYGPGRYDPQYEEHGQDYPYGYVRWTENRNMEAFLRFIEQKMVNVQRLITDRYTIDEAAQAYEDLLKKSSSSLGIVISYPRANEVRFSSVVNFGSTDRRGDVVLGIIGAGNHVRDRLLPCLRGWKAVHLKAVCTGTGVRAKALAKRLKSDYCTSNYQDLLEDSSINAVLIGTRHDMHARLVIDSLRAGKHVFVEKPLCLTDAELEEIVHTYEDVAQEGIHLMVGFNRRFSIHAEKAKEFFRHRKNPLVMSYRVNAGAIPAGHWIQDAVFGGGRVLGELCHFVDYLQAICGSLPSTIHAKRIAAHASGIRDDHCIVSLGFQDGSIGVITYAAGGDVAVGKERLEIFGDSRSLIMDDFITTELYASEKKQVFRSSKQNKGFAEEMDRFVTCITRGGDPPLPFYEIEAVTRTCLLAVQSLKTGDSYPIHCAIEQSC